MLAQTIQISFSSYAADTIRIHTGETGREIAFVPDMDISGEYSADFIVIKPDDTFTIAAATITDGKINVEIPEQAGAVAGAGHYILKIYDSGNVCIYSASGGFMVDDHLLTDGIIESVAEVHGYVFPDDFMTDDDLVFNPTSTASATVSKIKYKGITYGIEGEAGDISKTVTGNPIEITDGASAPIVKCVTQITGYQSGTGTPSPDNIRPITAYTEGEIEVRGHNVSDEVYEPGYIDLYTGVDSASNTTKRTVNYIKIQPNTQYCYVSSYATDVRIVFYGEDKSYVGYFGNNDANPQIFTTPNNAYYLRYYIGNAGYASVNYPKSVNTYEPYTSTTHTTTFPSAIYRGSEDVVKGTATTEWGMIASYAGETLPGEWISDRDEYAPGTTPTTGAQVAYALATPTTSSVTTTNLPIKSLSGYNHIESSTGDMEVEYITEEYQPLVDIIQRGSEDDYSTQEKIVGKWIDGTPLYEQTIVSNSNPGQTFTLPCPTDAEIKEIKGMARVFLSNRFYYKEICSTASAISWTDGKLDAEPKYGRINVYLNYPTGSAQVLAWVTIRYTKPLS